MSVEALQDYTFVSKYARFNEELKRREVWAESVDRVKQMHIRKYPQAKEQINWAFDRVLERRVLGSQRALQFGGKPIEKTNAKIYNCCFSYCDRVRFFQEAFYLLLCGSGVGFSVQKHHVAKLPKIHKPTNGGLIFTIPDSIAGWADALGVLLSSYMDTNSEYFGYEVEFDYKDISPKGTPLSSGAGKCPGPEPLAKSLEQIRKLLNNRLGEHEIFCIRPIDAYDIVMYSSEAVLSGGVRRSATIALFSPDDEEMAKAKTGNWFYENPQRGRSNNSALLIRGKTTKEEFDRLMEWVREFGEPGFIWADDTEAGYNPCVEIGLYAYDEEGNSGWHFCNLTEINGKMIKTEEDFETAVRAASIIGTLQAGYTSFPYLGKVSERITEREALIGVSMTGWMENPDLMFNPDVQRRMAELCKRINAEIAELIGINPAARCTCVKPSGTTSCMLGTSSGIHPHHSRRYFRRVQGNKLEAPLQFFASTNPEAVEESVWSKNDSVLTFCIETSDKAVTKDQLTAVQLLEKVRLTQQNWVEYGTRPERCVQPWLKHNVSNTITVQPHEWKDVGNFIFENRDYFAGVSLLPSTGDLDYPQAPFCAVSTPEELVKRYGAGTIFASGLIVDGLHAFNDLWVACDAVQGRYQIEEKPNMIHKEGVDLAAVEKVTKINLQTDWVRRAKKFAKQYFEEDMTKMLYCLKEVNNYHIWCRLKKSWKPVDYSQLVEETDETNLISESGCVGGKCEVQF